MKTVLISIPKKEVLLQVNLRNYYAGESAKSGDTMEAATKMQTSEDNFDVLNKYVSSACSKLVDVLNPVSVDVEFTEKTGNNSEVTLDYTIKVSDLYAESQNDVIKAGAFEYLVNWAIFEWLTLAFPSASQQFFQRCQLIEEGIRARINKRLKPTEK